MRPSLLKDEVFLSAIHMTQPNWQIC